MCLFITAVLPANTRLERLKPVCDRFKMSLKELCNPFVEAQIGGSRYVRATRGGCDCGTALGSLSALIPPAPDRLTQQRQIEVLGRKGWSQQKIDRWMAEKSTGAERNQHQADQARDSDLARWREFIGLLLTGGFCSQFGLLIHSYTGRLDDEKIQIKRVEHLSLLHCSDSQLMAMDEDVLYTFSKNLTSVSEAVALCR